MFQKPVAVYVPNSTSSFATSLLNGDLLLIC